MKKGTVAESEHPFTSEIGADDVRITNHFREEDPLAAIYSAIHEGGHAIFGQNISPDYAHTSVMQVDMMGLHESQSVSTKTSWDGILDSGPRFYPKLGELLPHFQEVPFDTFRKSHQLCRAEVMVRIDADEVTYCLHIILRYEIERAIFNDQVTTEELPALWNDKMEELLGIRPANDAEGVLQDTHWSDGSFGYFPSYVLGSIYDGMFLEAYSKQDLGSIDEILKNGDIMQITKWLNTNIHQYGSLYTSRQVIERLCHKEISAKPLLDYFNKKYSEIYS